MKICFITYEGIVLSKGGPFIKINSLKKHLEILGHQVDLFNLWEMSDKLSSYDIIKVFGGNLAIFSFLRNLKYRKINYIVNPIFFSRHSPSYLKGFCAIGGMIQRLAPGIWLEYCITKDICNGAELVLPNTTDEAELISKGFSVPVNRIEVIPNGVSENFIHGDPSLFKNKYGIENFILTVGHIGPKRKNVLALVKALQKIDHPSVIIGKALDMGETKEVMKVVKKNKKILLLDEMENNSPILASAYAACDTFVLPSQFETPGRAALEAALAGAKIVITPFGGTKDYFKDMALYVNPYSVESIQQGIGQSLNLRKSENLRNFIENNFIWEKVAEKTAAVIKNYLSKR